MFAAVEFGFAHPPGAVAVDPRHEVAPSRPDRLRARRTEEREERPCSVAFADTDHRCGLGLGEVKRGSGIGDAVERSAVRSTCGFVARSEGGSSSRGPLSGEQTTAGVRITPREHPGEVAGVNGTGESCLGGTKP